MQSRLIRPLLLAALAAGLAGCGGTAGGSGRLSLVAYSTPQEAYQQPVPAFQKAPAGRGVQSPQPYGTSGDEARAVQSGPPADLVALSLEPDVKKLVDAGDVAPDWNKDRYD